jgi:carbonic anhydrase
LESERHGLVDNWLRHIQDVREKYSDELAKIDKADARAARLCELNVVEQVNNVARTHVVIDAWTRGQTLAIHGWIYDVADGLIRDLHVTVSAQR